MKTSGFLQRDLRDKHVQRYCWNILGIKRLAVDDLTTRVKSKNGVVRHTALKCLWKDRAASREKSHNEATIWTLNRSKLGQFSGDSSSDDLKL